MIKNYGLDEKREEQEQDGTEYLGGSLKCIAEIPLKDREIYLPKGEVQRGKEDTMDCASRAPVNIAEAKLNYLLRNNLLPNELVNWLAQNGYLIDSHDPTKGVELSDAFIAIKSGTTIEGNSMKAPLQAIHDCGLIPKSMLPLGPDMTFDEYHNPSRITGEMEKLGKEFKKRLPMNYGKEYNFPRFLKKDMLCVGGHAWPDPVGGVYPRVEYGFNHEFVIWDPIIFAFDNYRDSFDGDFIKKLAPNFKFIKYGYRVAFKLGKVSGEKEMGFLEALVTIFSRIKWRRKKA